MKVVVRVKQRVCNSICNICTKEDCPFFDNISKNARYYKACEREFILNFIDLEEDIWCGGCECCISDYLCLKCANKRIDALKKTEEKK